MIQVDRPLIIGSHLTINADLSPYILHPNGKLIQVVQLTFKTGMPGHVTRFWRHVHPDEPKDYRYVELEFGKGRFWIPTRYLDFA